MVPHIDFTRQLIKYYTMPWHIRYFTYKNIMVICLKWALAVISFGKSFYIDFYEAELARNRIFRAVCYRSEATRRILFFKFTPSFAFYEFSAKWAIVYMTTTRNVPFCFITTASTEYFFFTNAIRKPLAAVYLLHVLFSILIVHITLRLSALVHKFDNILFHAAARDPAETVPILARSLARSWRVNFHTNGFAIAS